MIRITFLVVLIKMIINIVLTQIQDKYKMDLIIQNNKLNKKTQKCLICQDYKI